MINQIHGDLMITFVFLNSFIFLGYLLFFSQCGRELSKL